MAFGVMSKRLFEIMQPDVFEALLKNALPKGKESDDAETRKFAVKSLSQSLRTWGLHNVPTEILRECLETFYRCLNDYQVDRRGDVGSWVREAAMVALKDFIYSLFNPPAETLKTTYAEIRTLLGLDSPAFFERFVCSMIQQLCEKIDKVREVAGRNLQEFFKNVVVSNHQESSGLALMTQREELTALFI